ncbi:TPA: TrbI/VirB10 family protein [Pseudomonas aeruginosa]|uniref:TrbI/VirB10 family protein n=1 Tax=Pseudomonas aeruginosa TaxID=287 RepID=UPI000EB6087E|nr:TrbI/VirB10 family protein [Pseudomonas aeruginosa]MBI8222888.1 TrbI/VirB10 family protein [Pseudomonas aeruginosa]MDP5707988.1 TrbI/VirB10 family protein [Pseudomonas aeruginosa]HBO0349170.1 TrbI/VirB10 family protein [Pseudomonas aeruginosa]HCF2186016.1 TrbI/VirB10 family protein [Pseudomonas aeruginosa]HCW0993888.1 TrbI/VirB10 family protein [Pseudomonas aeruginosa]
MSATDASQDAAPAPLPPKVAPESLELRAQPRPVTRLNPRMLAVLAGGLASAVLGALLWSLQPQQRREDAEQRELYNVDRVTRSEGLDQLPADYSQLPPPVAPAVPQLGPPLPGDLGGPILRAEQAQGYDYRHSGADPAEAERLARLKEAEEVALSSVFFRSGGGRTSGAAPAGPNLAGQGGFDPLATGSASTTAAIADAAAPQNRQEQKEAFLRKSANAQIRNSGFLQMPDSPYQVMAGTVIAAALVTGIKSDLPGDVIATVTEPVYDSASGQHVLIPQGSRLLGRYNSEVSYGQSRVQVVWQRVILPDTSSFQLDNLVGSDTAGYAGLEDGVDWHWDRIVAGAAMTSLLGIGAELAAPENRTDGDRIVIAGRDSLQDSVNQVGQEATRRNLDIQPTLTQRPGLPLRVIVNRDLVLRPYQPLFIQQRNPQ